MFQEWTHLIDQKDDIMDFFKGFRISLTTRLKCIWYFAFKVMGKQFKVILMWLQYFFGFFCGKHYKASFWRAYLKVLLNLWLNLIKISHLFHIFTKNLMRPFLLNQSLLENNKNDYSQNMSILEINTNFLEI